jgi:hypothetical protein
VGNLVPRQEIMLAYLPIWLAYFWPGCPTHQPLQKTFNSYYKRQQHTIWSSSQVSITSSIQWCRLANIYGSKYMVLQVHKLASKILWRQNKDVYNSVSNYLIIQISLHSRYLFKYYSGLAFPHKYKPRGLQALDMQWVHEYWADPDPAPSAFFVGWGQNCFTQ